MKTGFILALLLSLTACTTVVGEKKRWGKAVDISFGTIVDVDQIPASAVASAAIVGGFRGIAAEDLHPQGEKNVARRLKDTSTYLYTIRGVSGDLTTYATEKQFMVKGDCVAIEHGASTNLRLVGDAECVRPNRRPPTTEQQIAASQCLLAKRQVILAQTDSELAVANRQMENLCQFRP